MADELKAWAPTWRDVAANWLQQAGKATGSSNYRAGQTARAITGGGQQGMGALDVTPVGALFAAQEGGLQAGEGVARASGGDLGGGLLQAGLGGLALAGVVPVAGPISDVSLAARRAQMLEKFGGKALREAQLSKKVLRAADIVPQAVDEAIVKTVRDAGKRVKVAPDIYRTMQATQGQDAVLRAVGRGEHLKPDGAGGYIGAPRTVDSPQALGALRRSLDNQFADSAEAVAIADPNRLGTWYERAKAGQAVSNEPHQLDRVLEQHGVYSAGVAPESELAFSLKHQNSRAVGSPTMAYRGAGMRTLDNAVEAGSPAPMGFKIGEYKDKNDPRIANDGLFGVNDFRAAQGFGYTTPDGKIWKGGVSATMHPVMDGETALGVQRANLGAVGGRTDWQGPHLQELPWVYGKAQDLYGRGKNGRFAGPDGVEAAIRDANNTAQDYFHKHAGAGTYEYVPGASTGHVPGMLQAPMAEKQAYGDVGRWDVPGGTPADLPAFGMPASVGAGNRDALYSAIGFRQLPSAPSSGAYMNAAGQMEHNPVTIARPLLDFPTGGTGQVADNTQQVMTAAERFRAVMDAQEAGAWNLPNTMNSVKGKNALLLDSRAYAPAGADPALGLQPTPEQMANLSGMLEGTGHSVSATSRGAAIFPTGDNPMPSSNIARKLGDWLTAEYPSTIQPAGMSTGYVPGIGKWSDSGGIAPTAPYSGEATKGLLQELATLSPDVTRNMGESEGIRSAIRAKTTRDAALPGARGDIQNTRNFFSEADWPKAVQMMRSGMTAAGALAALGYSMNSMAADGQQR